MKKLALFLFACNLAYAADVPYISGGVGLESREEMQSVAPGYNLHLVFSSGQGEYIADVEVEIKTASGNPVLRAIADGPWLYAKLQPGTYTVTAEQRGASITKRVVVNGAAPAKLHFSWS